MFQVEGAGVRDMLRKLRPDRFEDIIAANALYRPGPMENIPRYIAVKHGEEAPDYLHPALERILSATYGVMTYQEQVMQIAQVLGRLYAWRRRPVASRDGKEDPVGNGRATPAIRRGRRGARRREGAGRADLRSDGEICWLRLPQTHATAYALITYQTAYLKANYPVEFLAASMTLDLGNTDKLNVFRQELIRLGIRLLPPDINRSEVTFAVEQDAPSLPPRERGGKGGVNPQSVMHSPQ